EVLTELAQQHGVQTTDEEFAKFLDEKDNIAFLRDDFILPKYIKCPDKDGRLTIVSEAHNIIYLNGHSLGVQPKTSKQHIIKDLDGWAKKGSLCRSEPGKIFPKEDERLSVSMAKLVGAFPDEVSIMNTLSVNLHLLMVSFYTPTQTRHKILIEKQAFPSDYYIVQSQIEQRGFKPEDSIIQLQPRENEDILRTADILDVIEKQGDSIALVLLPGIQYYTGQLFDMEVITKAAQAKGCMVGYDLAHAVGNVELKLHDWEVDFACWCNYKYINSGVGAVGSAFMHRKHENNERPKFIGWWGHNASTRLDMTNELDLSPGINGYRISYPNSLGLCVLRASLAIFDKTNMREIREKSILLTGYLEHLLLSKVSKYIEIITPKDPEQRGCQLTLKLKYTASEVYSKLMKRHVICDVRKPNAIRVGPVPLYTRFIDVYWFVNILQEVLQDFTKKIVL
uniref:Kynureninase n=1 Tax=Ciona intestinalis TaxID=7719 RepID=F7A2G6_CIOIN